jgi:hypothetical protein
MTTDPSSTCLLSYAAGKERGSRGVSSLPLYTPPLPSLDVVNLRLLLKLTVSASSCNAFVLSSTPLFATLSDSHLGRLSHATSACSCSNPLQIGLRSHVPLDIHLDRRLFGASLSTVVFGTGPGCALLGQSGRLLGAYGVSPVLHYLG